jgi:hypothetical protein
MPSTRLSPRGCDASVGITRTRVPPHGSYGELVTDQKEQAMTLTTDSRFATAVLALAALAAVLAVFLVGMAIVDASIGHHIAGVTTTPTGPHA